MCLELHDFTVFWAEKGIIFIGSQKNREKTSTVFDQNKMFSIFGISLLWTPPKVSMTKSHELRYELIPHPPYFPYFAPRPIFFSLQTKIIIILSLNFTVFIYSFTELFIAPSFACGVGRVDFMCLFGIYRQIFHFKQCTTRMYKNTQWWCGGFFNLNLFFHTNWKCTLLCIQKAIQNKLVENF